MAIALNRGTSKRSKFPFVKSLGKVLPWFMKLLSPVPAGDRAGRRGLRLETLESRLAPAVTSVSLFADRPQSTAFLFNGSDAGVSAVVNSYYSNSNQLAFQTSVMGSGFTGGVRVATGDIDHDGMPDIIAAAGPGGGPRIQVLNGSTGASLSGTIGSFYAYDTAFSGGVQIAIADVNLDGYDDIITAPGAGGGPNIKIFSGYDASVLASFYAYDSAFTGGVSIATADYNKDGLFDLVVSPGIGGGPNVKVFDLSNLSSIGTISGALGSFWAFDSSFTGGVTLGTNPTYPDLTGDGIPDILVAQGPGTGSLVRVIDGSSGSVATEFSPLGTVTTGLRVATGLVNNDSIPDIIVGRVAGVSTNPLVYSGVTFTQNTSLSAGTVTALGTFTGKSGTTIGSTAIGGSSMSGTGAFVVGSTVNLAVQINGVGFDTPSGSVNLTVNYPDAALSYTVAANLTPSGTNAVATVPIIAAATGSMIITGIYNGDFIYRVSPINGNTFTISGMGSAPRPEPIDISDPVGSDSPRMLQTVMPIKFGDINRAGVDGYWKLENNDLPGGGLLGLTRTWSNKPDLASGAVGTGSTISDMPRLKKGTGSLIQLIVNSAKAYEFDQISSSYFSRFSQPFQIYAQTGNELVVATDSGRKFTFFDFSSGVPASQQGNFKSMLDEGGNLTSVQSWDSSGRPTEMTTVNVTASPSVTESIVYAYSTTSPNAGMLSSATLRRKVGTGSYSTVMTANYTYYDNSSSNGQAQDLKTVEVKNANNETINYQYYRYYTNALTTGYAHGLKYVLNFASYKRILNDLGDPDTKTDSQLAPYADDYFEYATSGASRISKHVIAGDGNSGNAGGLGAYTYTYGTNTKTTGGFNIWKTVMTETNPEGAVIKTYSNAAGQIMLSSFKESSSSTLEWAMYNHYDATGVIDYQADPAAIDTSSTNGKYRESWADLVNINVSGVATSLKNSEGIFTVYTYGTDATATATSSTAGSASGYISYVSIKRGQSSGLINKLNGYEYFSHTGNNVNTYITASLLSYPSEASSYAPTQAALKTTYSYDSWYTYLSGGFSISSAQPKSVTVTLPPVLTAQNGAGGSSGPTMTSVYDIYGRVIWGKDAGGFLAYTQYDAATMAPVKLIADVNASSTSDFSNLPSGWTTPSGGGLHLISTAEVDAYGRTTRATDPNGNVTYTVYKDANQEMRIYSGWTSTDSTHGSTLGPIITIRNDLANGYSESLTYSATPTVSGGKPTGTETVAGVTSLARTYTNIAGQTTATDSYFDLSGFTYSTAANLGTEGTNYLRMRYAYDDRGRQNRTQTPSGTISRVVYDKLGRSISSWTGLDDTPTSGTWSPTNTSGTDLVKTTEAKYDEDSSGNSGVGDSNVTSITEFPGGGATNRTTRMWYDGRNRVSIVKDGIESTENNSVNRKMVSYSYDNWDNVTIVRTFDGDGATPTQNADGSWFSGPIGYASYSTASYDNLGQLYQTAVYNITATVPFSSATILTTNYWYDSRGNAIKTSAPGGLVTKALYDGAGRLRTSYLSDGGGDSAFSDASTVSGDTVLTQSEMAYDANSNPIMVTTRDRFHNASGTGALDSTTSRASYSTAYYDSLDRVTSAINVGTNGGSAYSRLATAPSSSSTVLRTDYGYNSATGLLEKVTDPKGIESKSYYDAMGRTTKTVEANDGGAITATTNKTTEFGYDSYGHLSTVKAYRSSSDYSQTQYIYGVTTSTSGINNNDILASIRYPDKSTGNASSSITDSYTVNALGEVKTATDRLGTTHTYSRDVMGRLTADAVTTLGSGLNGAVRRIETAYDIQGNAYLFTSYDAATGGSVLNQVQEKFNGFGQLINEYQAHGGTVDTATTLNVGYSYTEGGTQSSPVNNSRLTGMVYPNGRALTYDYGSPPGTNDKISRLESIKDGSTTLESYQYLGVSQAVVRAHPQPNVDLTYVTQTSGTTGDAGDQYTGLDRFGRIVDQVWVKNTTPTPTITDRFQYGYDRNGNVLYKNNLVITAQSELYHANGAIAGYDNLNQLSSFARGTLTDINSDGIPDTIASPSQSQSFTPDGQGNFTTVTTNGTGVTRTYDKQNELTAVGSTGLTYDAAGNIKTDELNRTYIYDAWNRLISVSGAGTPSTPQASYAYDALGRRIKEISGGQTRELFYSAEWQVIEERVLNSATPPVLVAQVQYVWSPVYVDAMIERDRDTDANGSLDQRLYVQTDGNFNVTALLDTSGAVVERYVYDPYGKMTVLDAAGSVRTSGTSYNWQYLHQGGRQDSATGLLNFRNRDYSTSLMRWTTNDPIGFGGGDTNTYRYVGNGPGNALDPSGLEATNKAVYDDLGDLPAPNTVGYRGAGDRVADDVDLDPDQYWTSLCWVALSSLKQTVQEKAEEIAEKVAGYYNWKEKMPDGVTTIANPYRPPTEEERRAARAAMYAALEEAQYAAEDAVVAIKNGLYNAFVRPINNTVDFGLDVVYAGDLNYVIQNPYLKAYLKQDISGFEAWKSITLDAVDTVLIAEGLVKGLGRGLAGLLWSNCFPAGTIVATEMGPKPIENIQSSDLVWSFDMLLSEWKLRRVIETFQHDHDGEMVRVEMETESIESTGHHPWWVVRGENLEHRPQPEHVPHNPTGFQGQGRWVDATDLRVGDMLLLKSGEEAPITDLSRRHVSTKVYNFHVEEFHCYAVGNSQALVHNNSKALGRSLSNNLRARAPGEFAAHLVPAGNWQLSNRAQRVKDAISNSQRKINEFLPEGINGYYNGYWTKSPRHDGSHTDEYLLKMWDLLKDAKSENEVVSALNKLKDMLKKGLF